MQRHSRILTLLWLHVPVILLFALVQGVGWLHATVEAGAPAALGAMALYVRSSRRLSTVTTAVGLLTCSAVLVHLSGGVIEMHFHFFVMVGVVTLYQDWQPFLTAIAYVVLQHGIAGVISPASVYNHESAVQNPWPWAGVHGLFILGMSVAGIASWRLNEILLRETNDTLSLLSATLDSTVDGILVVDMDGRITTTNRRFVEMWAIPGHVLDAGDDAIALGHVVGQLRDPDAFLAKVNELYARPEAESSDVIEFIDGRVFERSSKPQRVGDAIVGRVWSFRDVTERKRLEAELSHQAFHDALTGLANQALFRDRVGHALTRAGRTGGRTAVLFLDVDNFKTVNDSLGHPTGDEVLTAVALRLVGSLRLADTAARLGGDEFAVLLEDLTVEAEALEVADRLLDAMRESFTAGDQEVHISASVGVAFDEGGVTTDQLLRNADLAMYSAKRHGKATYRVYEPDMHSAAVDRLELENDLRRALDRREMTVEYQPIVTLPGGALVGMEALVRWRHPTRGRLLPDTFIPVAEETGLIRELGRQVLLQACSQMRRWQLEHAGAEALSLTVNISPRQLHDGVLDHLTQALDVSGLPPANLVLEITETAMMQDADATVAKLLAMRALGVRLAIDDFGTGYSSLGYLQRLPIDVLKIDRAFVSGAAGTPGGDGTPDADGQSLVRAIIALAHNLGLKAVAEGVETAGQAAFLGELGCDDAQGFHFARPMTPMAIDALLRDTFTAALAQ